MSVWESVWSKVETQGEMFADVSRDRERLKLIRNDGYGIRTSFT